MDFSPIQIAIVLLIVLLVFGPKRLPELGKSMGRGFREFKDSITGSRESEEEKRQLESSEEEKAVDGEVVSDRRT